MTLFLTGLLAFASLLAAVFWFSIDQSETNNTSEDTKSSPAKTRLAGLATLVLVSAATYTVFGDPSYIAPRLFAGDNNEITELGSNLRPEAVSTLEDYGTLIAAGSSSKDDWIDIAERLRSGNRATEAADALQRAANLSMDPTEQVNLLGAAGVGLIQTNGGTVTADAASILSQALAIDPDSLGALYFLGIKARADGDSELARRHWLRFLNAAPEEHSLRTPVQNNLSLLDTPNPENAITPALTPEMRAQFADLSDSERAETISAMLSRVHTRLSGLGEAAGSDEWRDLARLYLNNQDYEGARDAYDRAIQRDPGNDALVLERSQISVD